jgi:hypothetical protein
MPGESASTRPNFEPALAELAKLRQLPGPGAEFWPRFLAAVQQLTSADHLTVLVRKRGEDWRRVTDWPREPAPSRLISTFFGGAAEFATRALAAPGGMAVVLDPKDGPGAGNFVIGVPLNLAQDDECVLIGVVSEISEPAAREIALRLALAAEVPGSYQRNFAAQQAKADVEKLASVLDLTVSVSDEKKFLPTALTFCNGLATRFQCDRVSLGWLERGWVRLRAISRTDQFDRQMAAAQALEVAMEEALDQDDEIVWPAPPGASVMSRDHERFGKEHHAAHLCSVPLRSGGEPIAVITCERNAAPFSEAELQQLRLSADLAAPRLVALKQEEQWLVARWASALRARSARLIGPEHTWAKLLALGIVAVLALLFFLRVPYRVEGNFVLRSDHLTYLAAPFDGYIDQVAVRPGDRVKAGARLLKLKTAELEVEESYALADVNRYQREAEKARAAKQLAEMRIAEAMANQAAARLNLVRYHIQEATLVSPFDGVVIEGDLRDRIGSPVKTADVLMKVAQIEALYVEAEVNERDVHEILGQESGEIAFVAQPKQKFPVQLTTVEKAAVPKSDGNVFLVRCAVSQRPEPWWRPGMSGVCKIDIGRRSLWWILTHRTVDFLRLKLWW